MSFSAFFSSSLEKKERHTKQMWEMVFFSVRSVSLRGSSTRASAVSARDTAEDKTRQIRRLCVLLLSLLLSPAFVSFEWTSC